MEAYLIDLLQYMLEGGVDIHAVPTHGGYFEIDTTQDYDLARAGWPRWIAGAMSGRRLPLFPTTVVGSTRRSAFVRDLLDVPEDAPGRAEAMDAAVAYIVALQG